MRLAASHPHHFPLNPAHNPQDSTRPSSPSPRGQAAHYCPTPSNAHARRGEDEVTGERKLEAGEAAWVEVLEGVIAVVVPK